jgi:hypothetical protein
VIGYVDSRISSAHDDIIERLAPRKTFEITGYTAPALWKAEQYGIIRTPRLFGVRANPGTFRDVVSGDAAPTRSRRLRDTEQDSAELAQRLSLSA